MTLVFRPWLPADTAAPRLVQGALADMADGWSRDWFVGEATRAAGALVRVDVRGELRKTAWHAHDGGLAIGISAGGVAALGAQVLGVAVAGAERSAADTVLLEAVGGDCFDDLKRRSAALLKLAEKGWSSTEAPRAGPVHRLEITGAARNPVLTLELSADLFVALVKSKLPPPPAPVALGKPADAIATLPVELTALLGRSAITVAELAGLATGDVLVLDRALDAPLPLVVGGTLAPRGACTVSEDGAALRITQALVAKL
ncbi:MAG: FliM/FliN family flagellar motor C-terminal domain-containing protein [Pseudomonadota bacterium]